MRGIVALLSMIGGMGCHRTPTDASAAPVGPDATPAGSTTSAAPSTAPAGAAAATGAADAGEERRTALARTAFRAVDPPLKAGQDPSNTTMWGYVLAPAVPATWPPDGRVLTYVYASGRRSSLADGEHVAAPFARIVSTPGAEDRLETLGRALVDRGTQGVRPLRREELAIPHATKLEAAVRGLTAASVQGPPPAELRASYCQWRSLNGVIAPDIVAAQPAFFRWLGC